MKYFTIFLAIFFLLTITLSAQTEKRVALVIGNSKYANNPLTNPVNDAREMARVLRIAGFAVTEQYDQNEDQFNNLVTDFARTIKEPNTVALFYYAGHGVQYKGENYLVPIGADNLKVEDQIEYSCIPLERITSKMQDANNKLNIIMLDACRSFTVTRGTRKLQNGLANTDYNTPELYIEYATGPGRVADDRPGSKNGLFTESLLKYIAQGVELKDLFYKTAREVKEKSNGAQLPIISGIVTQDFYFSPLKTKTSEPQIENLTADRDQDGVMDDVDRCPDAKGSKNLQGCPDSDNDGVIDILDKCPSVAGFSVNKGCPDLKTNDGAFKWQQCLGISYHHLSKTAGDNFYRQQALQIHYILAKKVAGFFSLGINYDQYVNNYVPVNGWNPVYPRENHNALYGFCGIGPGIRILSTPTNIKVYLFNDLLIRTDGRISYEIFSTCNMNKIGFKVGYVKNLGKNEGADLSGFSLGAHYCF